jgi:predicted methyltransferase MtxX (methanogen marker protein 4)
MFNEPDVCAKIPKSISYKLAALQLKPVGQTIAASAAAWLKPDTEAVPVFCAPAGIDGEAKAPIVPPVANWIKLIVVADATLEATARNAVAVRILRSVFMVFF